MKYAYEDLGDEQFETLVVLLCQRLLGIRAGFPALSPSFEHSARDGSRRGISLRSGRLLHHRCSEDRRFAYGAQRRDCAPT